MSSVTRYRLCDMETADSGDFVFYEDYEELKKRFEELREAVAEGYQTLIKDIEWLKHRL